MVLLLQEAATHLGIGLSVLKRVCRTIGLARWPYRKRQSLRNVIEQTKLYLVSTGPGFLCPLHGAQD